MSGRHRLIGVMDQESPVHPKTGRVLNRDVRLTHFDYLGRTRTIELPGGYLEDPRYEDNAILEASDARILDRAFNEMRAEADGLPIPAEGRRIRRGLRLSQRLASEVLGVDQRSFQKYESGEVIVRKPMANPLRSLEQDPSRMKELLMDRAA